MEFKYTLSVPEEFPDCAVGDIRIEYEFVVIGPSRVTYTPSPSTVVKICKAIESGRATSSDCYHEWDVLLGKLCLSLGAAGTIPVVEIEVPIRKCAAAFTTARDVLAGFSADPAAFAAKNRDKWE